MNVDYNFYTLSWKEKLQFYVIGYTGFLTVGYIFYKNVLLSVLCGFVILGFLGKYKSYKADKRKNFLLMQFKDLLYSLSATISTGKSMAEGIRDGLRNLSMVYDDETPMIKELKLIERGIFENRDSETRLFSDFAKRSGCRDIQSFVDVYLSVRDTGGDMEKVISKTSQILTDKITIEREIKAIISQKQTEAKIIMVMPLVIIIGLNITSSGYIDPMYETAVGRIIMTISLASMIFAYRMINKITDIKV